ncbi:MAG TPA: hypothetical protein VGG16_14435 [Streptosporangiaceae bacterium]
MKRTWWIAPYFGGILAVFAVAGLLSLTVFHHSPVKHAEAAATAPAKTALADAGPDGHRHPVPDADP